MWYASDKAQELEDAIEREAEEVWWIQVWNLKRWDQARHWEDWELVTFIKMDGTYAHWKDEDWKTKVWHTDYYVKWSDWIYIW